MAIQLPPIPNNPVTDTHVWRDWFFKVSQILVQSAAIAWTSLNFTGSNLLDIQTRQHNALQDMQGGLTNEYYHLTSAQYTALSSGYVSSVSGTSPISSSGGLTPTISIVAASTSVSGYLTSTDWNTFNGKYSTGGALGTPSSGTLTNCTGLPYSGLTGTVPTWNQNTTGTASNLSGTPALPNGTSATTQSAGDNSTKLATTAYVDGANRSSVYSLQTPTTGFSITIGANVQYLVLNPAGTLATGTITMPASPVDGFVVTVSSSKVITALTVSPNTGQTLQNAPTTLQLLVNTPGAISGYSFSYIYSTSTTTWYRIL